MHKSALSLLNSVIKRVFSEEKQNEFDVQEAILEFVCYLRHPNDLKKAHFAYIFFDLAYKARWAEANCSIDDIKKSGFYLSSGKVTSIVNQIDTSRFAELNVSNWSNRTSLDDFGADIVKFIMAHCSTDELKERVSIKKAHYYFKKVHKKDLSWRYSWRNFSTRWVATKNICFYLYTNMYLYNNMLNLLPQDKYFYEKVTALASDCLELQDYFSAARSVRYTLKEALDPRATRGMKFPKLPDRPELTFLLKEPLSAEEIGAMRSYKSTHDV